MATTISQVRLSSLPSSSLVGALNNMLIAWRDLLTVCLKRCASLIQEHTRESVLYQLVEVSLPSLSFLAPGLGLTFRSSSFISTPPN